MNKETSKKITLEQLATKIDRGFKESDKRTDDKIDKLARAVKEGFDEVRQVINEFNSRVGNIDSRIESLDSRVGNIDSRIESLDLKIESLDSRIENLRLDINSGFERADSRFREIQEEIDGINKHLEKIEKLSLEDSDFLSDEVMILKKKNKIFEKRLQKLESKFPARI